MTEQYPNRRIKHLDLFIVTTSFLTVRKHIAAPDEEASARHFQSAATLGYALGLPLSEIRAYGREALHRYIEVLRNRPPLEAFKSQIAPGSWLDYSIGSSRVSLDYLYWALLLRERDLAREIAENTWDTPEMGRVRIYPEYRVAYALRDLILGRKVEAVNELERLPASSKVYLHKQAKAISALAREARSDVTPAIVELSGATHIAMSREYLPYKKIFALPGAGLASYALDQELITKDELPHHIDTFPLELVLTPE